MIIREEVYCPGSTKEAAVFARAGLCSLDWLLASIVIDCRV
jgi:hypothetical protein